MGTPCVRDAWGPRPRPGWGKWGTPGNRGGKWGSGEGSGEVFLLLSQKPPRGRGRDYHRDKGGISRGISRGISPTGTSSRLEPGPGAPGFRSLDGHRGICIRTDWECHSHRLKYQIPSPQIRTKYPTIPYPQIMQMRMLKRDSANAHARDAYAHALALCSHACSARKPQRACSARTWAGGRPREPCASNRGKQAAGSELQANEG